VERIIFEKINNMSVANDCSEAIIVDLLRQACYSSCSFTHRKLVEDAEQLELQPFFRTSFVALYHQSTISSGHVR